MLIILTLYLVLAWLIFAKRQGAWPYGATHAPLPRRRGGRMSLSQCDNLRPGESGSGHSRRDWLRATIGPRPLRPESGSEIRALACASMSLSGPNALGSEVADSYRRPLNLPLDCPVTLPPA
jgi:hypothetical protein